MSPLALLLKGLGHSVSGSDMKSSSVTEQLTQAGVSVSIGHSAAAVSDADVVVYSTAIPQENVELVAGRRHGIAVRHRSDLLASLCASFESIGVAGTHGKTTTSALLTHILITAGKDPSCVIGADVPGMGIGARAGQSPLFVLESDESDGTLDILPLSHLIVTNVDVDHLDYFGTFEEVQKCFVEAVSRTTGHVVLNIDDTGSSPVVHSVAQRGNVTTFGTSPHADVVVSRVDPTVSGLRVELKVHDVHHALSLPLRGEHNVAMPVKRLNLLLVLAGGSQNAACSTVRHSLMTTRICRQRFKRHYSRHALIRYSQANSLPCFNPIVFIALRQWPTHMPIVLRRPTWLSLPMSMRLAQQSLKVSRANWL